MRLHIYPINHLRGWRKIGTDYLTEPLIHIVITLFGRDLFYLDVEVCGDNKDYRAFCFDMSLFGLGGGIELWRNP